MGYWIGVPFWGNGYIPEAVREIQRHAFEDLGCTAMWCGYYDGKMWVQISSYRGKQAVYFDWRC